ncbi:MAG: bifunctional methylenetetrahydrofolate dehydrogenase/methenyltetrahydrofolate cyclohydrolase FolD [Alphaproteobacteria bacterium]|nr:bifunctional methylenetetrahydrofolate dehydrogenase/methenyltetrahydrofolate cyclohydrolase FolD [Alphaproteobacteria bacterium]
MSPILDGKEIAKSLRKKLAEEIVSEKLSPGLAVVLVGEDPASQVYVRNKAKAADETGIKSWTHRLPASATQEELLALIDRLNRDDAVHGILVQLPVPRQIDPQTIIAAIDPEKDVDGFHPVNAGRLALGLPGFVPCTPQGCMILLREVLSDPSGKRALVIGRSNIVGKPVAQLLLQANCTVTVAHSRTQDLPLECARADIVVAAIGKPQFVKGNWIKEGAIVLDVGVNRLPDGRLVGDVDFETAKERASAITPVPGGVGPMTIACLMKNTVESARKKRLRPSSDSRLLRPKQY